MVRYSVCITNYNSRDTIEGSLDSILSQCDSEWEVVVVDNFSNDGSEIILKRLAEEGRIKLIQKRSTPGQGRQVAYEAASGDYLLQMIDTDNLYLPYFRHVLSGFTALERYIGDHALLCEQDFMLCSQKLMDMVGPWPYLYWVEDYYIYSKLASVRRLKYFPLMIGINMRPHRRDRKLLQNLGREYLIKRNYGLIRRRGLCDALLTDFNPLHLLKQILEGKEPLRTLVDAALTAIAFIDSRLRTPMEVPVKNLRIENYVLRKKELRIFLQHFFESLE